MRKLVNNEYYDISVDSVKNRLYLRIKGFWKSQEVVPDYVSDIRVAGRELQRGFTLLSDLREMATPPLDVNKVHEQAQHALMESGLERTAEIVSDILIKSLAKRIADQTQMNKQEFESPEEAERWLDEVVVY